LILFERAAFAVKKDVGEDKIELKFWTKESLLKLKAIINQFFFSKNHHPLCCGIVRTKLICFHMTSSNLILNSYMYILLCRQYAVKMQTFCHYFCTCYQNAKKKSQKAWKFSAICLYICKTIVWHLPNVKKDNWLIESRIAYELKIIQKAGKDTFLEKWSWIYFSFCYFAFHVF
jgi:hypothetical protein